MRGRCGGACAEFLSALDHECAYSNCLSPLDDVQRQIKAARMAKGAKGFFKRTPTVVGIRAPAAEATRGPRPNDGGR